MNGSPQDPTNGPRPVEDDFDFGPSNRPAPDRAVIRRHLDLMKDTAGTEYEDGLIEIAHDDPARGDFGPNHSRLFGLDELDAAADFAVEKNAARRNVWVATALKKPDTPREGRTKAEAHFYAAPIVPFDADEDAEAVCRRVTQVCEPVARVTTGTVPETRVQGWLPLIEPCTDYAAYKAAFNALNDHVGGDEDARGDLMRLPGTVSFPPPKKQAKGYQTELTTVAVNPAAAAVSIERLTELAPLADRARKKRAREPNGHDPKAGTPPEPPPKPGSLARRLLLLELNDALRWIPADKPEYIPEGPGDRSGGGRALWIDMGQALSWFGDDGWQLWSKWSATSTRYDATEALEEWSSFHPDSITWRSVFAEAQDRGWPNPGAANDDEEDGDEAMDGQAGAAWADPDRSMLGDGLAPAPALPLQVFGLWTPWLADSAATVSAPVDYAAGGLLAAAAAAVGTSRRVSPWGGWEEYPALWCLNVGSPSASKSPIYSPLVATVQGLEREEGADFDLKRRQWEADKLVAKARREQWEQDTKAAASGGRAFVPPMPADADDPEEPRPPRLVVSDATIESLTPLFKANPRGLLLARDELAGWIGNFGKYGGDGDAAYFLERRDGAPATTDRVKTGNVHADPALLSVFGGIQPERMSSLMLIRPDDGLVARFCYFYPDPATRHRPTKVVNKDLLAAALRRLRGLPFDVDGDGRSIARIVRLTDEAAQTFEKWWQANGEEATDALGLHQGTLGKGPGVVLRIALLIELLEWAIRPPSPEPTTVGMDAVVRAAALFDGYLARMALRVFGWTGLPVAERNATALLRAIRKTGQRQVNGRDLRRARAGGLSTPEAVTEALDRLMAGGWLRYAGGRVGGGKGRQREDWDVNPALWDRR
jgi:hypothetical protein